MRPALEFPRLAGSGWRPPALFFLQGNSRMDWNLSTDVVVIGAGAAGLAAAVSARDHGAAVIVVEENFDIGGHAMLSGGRVHLGGGNALQQKFNIKDSPDRVF